MTELKAILYVESGMSFMRESEDELDVKMVAGLMLKLFGYCSFHFPCSLFTGKSDIKH